MWWHLKRLAERLYVNLRLGFILFLFESTAWCSTAAQMTSLKQTNNCKWMSNTLSMLLRFKTQLFSSLKCLLKLFTNTQTCTIWLNECAVVKQIISFVSALEAWAGREWSEFSLCIICMTLTTGQFVQSVFIHPETTNVLIIQTFALASNTSACTDCKRVSVCL